MTRSIWICLLGKCFTCYLQDGSGEIDPEEMEEIFTQVFYFFSTGFEISHFQETLQDSARNRRRPKRNSGQGEGEREGSGGKEEQKGGGKGVGADEKKTPLWLQRASLLQQKDDKVSFFMEEQQQKMSQ